MSQAPLAISIERIEHDKELHRGVEILAGEYQLFERIVGEILALAPDKGKWRLTLTGDVAATVNSIEGRAANDGYTTDRGAGHVGGVTLPRSDGTFDIVIGLDRIVDPPAPYDDLESAVRLAVATAHHLGSHEAGHVALALRGEASDSYGDKHDLVPSAAIWARQLAAYMDDFRIERHTRAHAPAVDSQQRNLSDAIDHLSSELNGARFTWHVDETESARRCDLAVGGFIRVIAYLAAELGLDDKGQPMLPEPLPEKWERYLGEIWPIWSKAFHRLSPVTEEMSLEDLVTVLTELCLLASNWSGAIGYERSYAQGELTLEEY